MTSVIRLMLAGELGFGGCDDYSMNQTEEQWELSTLAVYFRFAILTAVSIWIVFCSLEHWQNAFDFGTGKTDVLYLMSDKFELTYISFWWLYMYTKSTWNTDSLNLRSVEEGRLCRNVWDSSSTRQTDYSFLIRLKLQHLKRWATWNFCLL